jgi:hydrogenase-4 membrane subunit HyfE
MTITTVLINQTKTLRIYITLYFMQSSLGVSISFFISTWSSEKSTTLPRGQGMM